MSNYNTGRWLRWLNYLGLYQTVKWLFESRTRTSFGSYCMGILFCSPVKEDYVEVPFQLKPRNNTTPHTTGKSEMDVSTQDIRLAFPHDLTGHVTRSSEHPHTSGGFSDVYRGELFVQGKSTHVTIKVYRVYLQRDERSEDKVDHFHKEITVWLKLRHPNVLPLFGTVRDVDMNTGIPAMICPWIKNGALSGYLEHNKDLLEAERLSIIIDVAHGLQYLHSQGVIHGDLSGSNVLVDARGRACVGDFGSSMLLTSISGQVTRRHTGTVRWMAPELLDPHPHKPGLNMRSDVYSFGSIMFQTLTGKIPYHHLPRDEQVIYTLFRGMKPNGPTRTVVTDDVWRFIERCWSGGDKRPSSDEIVQLTNELADSMVGEDG